MKKTALLFAFLSAFSFRLVAQEWLIMETGLDTFHDVRFISAVSDDVVWGLAGDYGSVGTTKFVTTLDGGALWGYGTVDHTCTECFASDIFALDAFTAWAIYVDDAGPDRIYKTTDAGFTWLLQSNANMFALGASYIDFIYFWDADKGIVVGDPLSGIYEIYTTQNGGTTWEVLPAANIPLALASEYAIVGAYGLKGEELYFGTSKGRIFKSADYGQTWTVTPTPWTTRWISGIVFFNENEGIATNGFNSSSNSEVLVTTDGGTTWNIFAGSSTVPVTRRQGLSLVPGSTYDAAVITGWEGSLYTIDGGTNWEIIDDFFHWDGQMTSPTVGWSGGPNGKIYKFNGSLTGVSTKDPALQTFKAFPNPVTDALTIEGQLASPSDITLTVTDFLGREVFSETRLQQPAGAFRQELETQGWTPGTYFACIRTDNGEGGSLKIVRIQ